MFGKIYTGLVLVIFFMNTGHACSLIDQYSYDVFTESDTIVVGHWVKDREAIVFQVENTWFGEEVPSGKYAVYYEGNLTASCETTSIRYSPRSVREVRVALAVYPVSGGGLTLGFFSQAAQAAVLNNHSIHVEGYHHPYDYESHYKFRLTLRDFKRAQELSRDDRRVYFHRLREGRTRLSHSDR